MQVCEERVTVNCGLGCDLKHCFFGKHGIKIDVECCVQTPLTSGLNIEAASLYQNDRDPPGKMECSILTD